MNSVAGPAAPSPTPAPHPGRSQPFATGPRRAILTAVAFAAALASLARPATLTAAAPARPLIVINEIHYDPADKRPLEFVELHNPGSRPVRISGWTLEKFRFPEGTTIAPGGFAVIAQDPAVFLAAHGFTPLGPLSGKLSNSGEKLTLRDADDRVVDEVRYGAGFPWPTAANGAGPSLERIHPALPSGEPGSWRSAGYPLLPPATNGRVFIPAGDDRWRWRRGTNEASSPLEAWREPAFAEDASWAPARLPIGYEDDDDTTVLTDMQGRYSSLFLRRRFGLDRPPSPGTGAPTAGADAGTNPAALLLRVRVDDGCVVWLNGREVARLHVRPGPALFNGVAENHESGEEFEEVLIDNLSGLLRPGPDANVLAVQAFNASRASSDLTFDAELRTPEGSPRGRRPTPGATNSVFSPVTPPRFAASAHHPLQPRAGEPVTVTARFAAGARPESVTLETQIVEPGAYIRRTDAAYRTNWTAWPMRDDGKEADEKRRDGTYTVRLPDSLQVHRRLVRYRIRATDAEGRASIAPLPDDPVPNFAWFVYDGLPAWTGARRPGRTPPETFPAEFMRTMPAYHLLARAEDVARSQWDGSANRRRFPGTFVVDGQVLDHIEFHNRGTGSAHISGKNKWGFRFQRTHELATRSIHGEPRQERWDSLNLNPGLSTPYMPVHCGIAGLDEALAFRAFQLAGVPAANTHWVQLRVIDQPEEAPATNQYGGDLFGLYLAIQDMDGSLLREQGLPDGNIYSMQSGRKHLARGAAADGSDWDQFLRGVRSGSPETWWRQHLDLPAYFSFHAINRVIGNVDLRPDGNHGYYRRPDGRWLAYPWDHDMLLVPRTHQPGHIDAVRCLDVPAIRLEFRNRAREILDLFCADASTNGGQVGQLVAELSGALRPAGFNQDWGRLDAAVWDWNPRHNQKGSFYVNPASGGHFGGPWERRLASPDLAGFTRYIVEFCTDARPEKNYQPNDGNQLGYGFGYLAHEARDARIPDRPRIAPAEADFPRSLRLTVSPFVSPATNRFAALQWRVGWISSPGLAGFEPGRAWRYEVEPHWTSPSLPAAETTFLIPPKVCTPGRTYRVRARYQDHTGRWSHWSDPVEFAAPRAAR